MSGTNSSRPPSPPSSRKALPLCLLIGRSSGGRTVLVLCSRKLAPRNSRSRRWLFRTVQLTVSSGNSRRVQTDSSRSNSSASVDA